MKKLSYSHKHFISGNIYIIEKYAGEMNVEKKKKKDLRPAYDDMPMR